MSKQHSEDGSRRRRLRLIQSGATEDGSMGYVSRNNTLQDIDFSDPGILADIRAVFAVLAEIEPVQTDPQLRAA